MNKTNKLILCIVFLVIFLGILVVTDNAVEIDNINITAKPSCGCNNDYVWYNHTFVNMCPNCGHINCLLDNPKNVPEHELTCSYCDSDFCGVCGKEKYSWSNVYLEEVK